MFNIVEYIQETIDNFASIVGLDVKNNATILYYMYLWFISTTPK